MIDWNRVCPFCGSVMVGTNGHPICHSNPDCVIHDESIPQELLDKLETTRKALDLAIKHLEGIRGCDKSGKPMTGVISCWIDCDELAKALEQIESITKR